MPVDLEPKESAPSSAIEPTLPAVERKRRRRELWIGAAVVVVLFALLRHPLHAGAGRSVEHGGLFLFLNGTTVILILLLGFLVTRNFWKLVAERRRGILGSHLNLKFVSAFLLISLLTTFGLFAVSAFVISSSMDRWFGVRVGRALEQSGEVAEIYYEATAESALFFSERIAARIAVNNLLGSNRRAILEKTIRERQRDYNLAGVEVFGAGGEPLVSAINPEIPATRDSRTEGSFVQSGLDGESRWRVEEAGSGDWLRAVTPVGAKDSDGGVIGAVIVNVFIPSSQARRVAAIRATLDEYWKLQPSAEEIRHAYLLELLLASLVVLILATWMGFRLAKGVTEPIRALAKGTAEVARGNLEVKVAAPSDDEVGILVQSFNRMTRDLRDARSDIEQSAAELERRRRYMEIVLGTIGAGVVSLDADERISTINPSARRFLGLSAGHQVIGRRLRDETPRAELVEVISDLAGHLRPGVRDTICSQVQAAEGDDTATLLVTLAVLHDEAGEQLGTVVVLDDLTQLVKVERMAAWREVARRIAHEIKNPLTPIQLSAQRIRRRFRSRLSGSPEDVVIFDQCVDSISSHVENLKLLVEEFSKFAKLPTANPRPDDLNQIVLDVVSGYSGTEGIVFETHLDADLPFIELDRQQIRRALANLIDNAIAAVRRLRDADPEYRGGRVTLCTEYFVPLESVRIEISDDGAGISADDHRRIFEPYFSIQRRGTGLGLAIVAQIVADHRGYVRASDCETRGAKFVIDLPVPTSMNRAQPRAAGEEPPPQPQPSGARPPTPNPGV